MLPGGSYWQTPMCKCKSAKVYGERKTTRPSGSRMTGKVDANSYGEGRSHIPVNYAEHGTQSLVYIHMHIRIHIHVHTHIHIHEHTHIHPYTYIIPPPPPPDTYTSIFKTKKNRKKKKKKYLAHPALQSDPTSGKNPRPPPDTCPLPSRTPAAPPGAVRLICFLKN